MAENKDSYKPDLFDPKYLVTLDEIYHSHWAARKKQRMQFLREAVDYFWPKGHPSRLITWNRDYDLPVIPVHGQDHMCLITRNGFT